MDTFKVWLTDLIAEWCVHVQCVRSLRVGVSPDRPIVPLALAASSTRAKRERGRMCGDSVA